MNPRTAPRATPQLTTQSSQGVGGGVELTSERSAPGVSGLDARMADTPCGPARSPALLTAEDVAADWQVSVSMVYKLRREGKLPFVRIGTLYRFDPDVVRAYARGEVPARRRGR